MTICHPNLQLQCSWGGRLRIRLLKLDTSIEIVARDLIRLGTKEEYSMKCSHSTSPDAKKVGWDENGHKDTYRFVIVWETSGLALGRIGVDQRRERHISVIELENWSL